MPEIKETEQITRTGAKALENTGTAEANNDPQDALYQKTQALVLQAENCVDTANEKLEEIESTAAEIQEALNTKKDAILQEITVQKQAACNNISAAGTTYIELAEEKFNEIMELDPVDRDLSNITNNGTNVIKQSLSAEIGTINSTLNQKLNIADVKSYITTTYRSGASGYKIWSNKLCEQWGIATGGVGTTITLLVQYQDTNYIILLQGMNQGSGASPTINTSNKAKNKFTATMTSYAGGAGGAPVMWYTCGYTN